MCLLSSPQQRMAAMADQTVLDGYTPEPEWAAGAGISQRTSARYRNQINGLPFMEFGGRIYIPNDLAREWLRARIQHLNPRRRAA
jgi:hypothetical protein